MTRSPPIIAATDLSAHARHAADRAARVAALAGAELTLVHVPPAAALAELRQWLGQDVQARIEEEAARALEALAAELRATRGVTVHARLAHGPVLDEVERAADELAAGLIVVGARGQGFLRRLVLGTTAERLLRRTRHPVLIVRTLAHERYRRALLAVDFSPYSAPVLALADRFAPDARRVLFHAFQVPFEEKLRFAGVDGPVIDSYRAQARLQAEQRMQSLAGAAGLKRGGWDACIVEGEASLRLVEQEQVQDCDLVVLGKQGHGLLEDLLLGSTTKHLLAEGTVDVLVAPRAGRP